MADPTIPQDFDALRLLTAEQLVQLGCRRWDETGLVLFPWQWWDYIPEGFVVRTVMGVERAFSKSWESGRPGANDRRLGMLAFGIVACPKEFAPTVSDRRADPGEQVYGLIAARRIEGTGTIGNNIAVITMGDLEEKLDPDMMPPPNYPPGWPECPSCGLPALDGHITCGQAGCDEAGHRNRRG